MDDFVAYPSPWRIALLILGSMGFVVLGLKMAGAFGLSPRSGNPSPVGWFSVIFFGFCAIMGMKMLFNTREQVRIGATGIRWTRWSDQLIPWSEIEKVTTWHYKGQKSIILHLRDPDLFPGRGILGRAAKANRLMTGGDIGITMIGTNRSFADAMAAIDRFRPTTH